MQLTDIFRHQPIAAYRLLRFLPTMETYSELKDPILRVLLGSEDEDYVPGAGDLKLDVLYALSRAALNTPLPAPIVSDLESMSKESISCWPLAARAHVLSSPIRAEEARKRLSSQTMPFVLPGDLHPLQVEALAAGDQVFGALHIEWMRKLAALVLEALPLDCNHLGFWFGPLIDVLPEKAFEKALKKLLRRRRLTTGGWGLAAIYAKKINLNPDPWLCRGGEADSQLFTLGCQGFAR